jgi:hypothetical protein
MVRALVGSGINTQSNCNRQGKTIANICYKRKRKPCDLYVSTGCSGPGHTACVGRQWKVKAMARQTPINRNWEDRSKDNPTGL